MKLELFLETAFDGHMGDSRTMFYGREGPATDEEYQDDRFMAAHEIWHFFAFLCRT